MTRKRKRKQTSWYLVQAGDILERSSDKQELVDLCKVYLSLNTNCSVVSKSEYDREQKDINKSERIRKKQRRRDLEKRQELMESQNAIMEEATIMDKKRKRNDEMYESRKSSDFKRSKTTEKSLNNKATVSECKGLSRDEKRSQISESYKTLYPRSYNWN